MGVSDAFVLMFGFSMVLHGVARVLEGRHRRTSPVPFPGFPGKYLT
jgi:hypothetical protein